MTNEPSRQAFAQARQINLARHPGSDAARQTTATITRIVAPHLARSRPLGRKGMATLQEDLGIVLAGLLRSGATGSPCRAQRSPSGPMWDGAPIGRDRFWSITTALASAGLVHVLDGLKTPGAQGDGRGGLATALWPSSALIDLAASYGATTSTREADWRADPALPAKSRPGREVDLVTCRERQPSEPVPFTPAMESELVGLRADIAAINAVNASIDIKGAGHSVALVQRFKHSLAFGGRFYAPYTTLSAVERQAITFNGSPVCEVDVRASQLTILLGTTGHREAPLDAYMTPGFPRDVVKAWTIQTLGAGRPLSRWGARQSGVSAGFSATAVRDAMLTRLPFLASLPLLVPAAALATLPVEAHHWAAGQWLVRQEAAIIAHAMCALTQGGIAVLPVHDSLIVAAGAEGQARDALRTAFVEVAGIAPRLSVTRSAALFRRTPTQQAAA